MKTWPGKTGLCHWPRQSRRSAQLGWAALTLIAAADATGARGQTAAAPPTDAEILAIVNTHCVRCHATEPTHEAFAKPPADIVLETIEEISRNAPKIMSQVVVQRAMPLGNETGMTDAERDRLAAWIEGRK
jgi:uncharacterized membrane protein